MIHDLKHCRILPLRWSSWRRTGETRRSCWSSTAWTSTETRPASSSARCSLTWSPSMETFSAPASSFITSGYEGAASVNLCSSCPPLGGIVSPSFLCCHCWFSAVWLELQVLEFLLIFVTLDVGCETKLFHSVSRLQRLTSLASTYSYTKNTRLNEQHHEKSHRLIFFALALLFPTLKLMFLSAVLTKTLFFH